MGKGKIFYKILEIPFVHNFVQMVLSISRKKVEKLTEKIILDNCRGQILDLGCGTRRYAHLFSKDYTGLDIIRKYLGNHKNFGNHFICGDASSLPFRKTSFNSIFTVGFFHHLDSKTTLQVFKEINRILAPNGKILIIDAFWPERKCDLLGYLLIGLDRGSNVRHKKTFIDELKGNFNLLNDAKMEYSYPYNLHFFILTKI